MGAISEITIIERPIYKRIRTVAEWSIESDEFGSLILSGRVIKDSEPDFNGQLRFTRTSPITRCDGFKIFTQSGSEYELWGQPLEEYKQLCLKLGTPYTGEKPIPWI